jgi:phosphofructokinase
MSELAVDCLVRGEHNCITGYVDGQIRAISYEMAKTMKFGIDKSQYELISILSH